MLGGQTGISPGASGRLHMDGTSWGVSDCVLGMRWTARRLFEFGCTVLLVTGSCSSGAVYP